MSKNLYHARTELCPDIQWPMWYKLSVEADGENFMDIPEDSELLTNNGISMVWRGNDGYIYKQSIPYLIENEAYFLGLDSQFIPFGEREGKYTIALLDYGESGKFANLESARRWAYDVLSNFQDLGIRHGDITKPNVIITGTLSPKIIDWAEARLGNDPRPSKRKFNDGYWLRKTFEELCDDKE